MKKRVLSLITTLCLLFALLPTTAFAESCSHIDENKDHVCDKENCKATISTCYGGTATCSNKAVCDYCGKLYGGFDSSNHAGGTEIKNDRDATCTEEGYTGDTFCRGCGEKVSSGSSTPKLGHIDENKDNVCDRTNCKAIISADTYCNGCDTKLSAVPKEATATSTGTKTYTCKNCGHSYEEEIAELTSQSTSPQTSDNSYMALWFVLLFISGGALVGTAAYGRKKKYSAK